MKHNEFASLIAIYLDIRVRKKKENNFNSVPVINYPKQCPRNCRKTVNSTLPIKDQ